jgi:hypothetical protein
MPEETRAPEEGKPDSTDAPAAPEVESGQASEQPEYFDEKFDPASLPDELKGAYKQMRDAFSSKTQTLAEQRREAQEALELQQALRDPDSNPELLERYGLLVEGDEEPEFEQYDDPTEALEQRIAQLEAERQTEHQTREQAELEEAEIAYVNQGLSDLMKTTGRDDFSPEEIQLIGDLSRLRRDPEGLPDVQGAYNAIYAEALGKERSRWVGQKNSPQAPAGGAAVEVPDTDNPRDRVDYMAQKLAELEADIPGN